MTRKPKKEDALAELLAAASAAVLTDLILQLAKVRQDNIRRPAFQEEFARMLPDWRELN